MSGYSLFVETHYHGENTDGCALAWSNLTSSKRDSYRLHATSEPVSNSKKHTNERNGVQGYGEVDKSTFSYMSTNVSKTMKKNQWPKYLVDSMTKFIERVTSNEMKYRFNDIIIPSVSKVFDLRDEQGMLNVLSLTENELSAWMQVAENHSLILQLTKAVASGASQYHQIANDMTYLKLVFAALVNPHTDWSDGEEINKIRPLLVLYAFYKGDPRPAYPAAWVWNAIADKGKPTWNSLAQGGKQFGFHWTQ